MLLPAPCNLDHHLKWVCSRISLHRIPISIGIRACLARSGELAAAAGSSIFRNPIAEVTWRESRRRRGRRCVSPRRAQARPQRHLINNWGGPGSVQGGAGRRGGSSARSPPPDKRHAPALWVAGGPQADVREWRGGAPRRRGAHRTVDSSTRCKVTHGGARGSWRRGEQRMTQSAAGPATPLCEDQAMMVREVALAAAQVTLSGLCQPGDIHPEPLRLAATAAFQYSIMLSSYIRRPRGRGVEAFRVRRHRMAMMFALGQSPTHTAPSAQWVAARWSWRTQRPALVPSSGGTASRAAAVTQATASSCESGGHRGGATGVLVPAVESACGITWLSCVASTDKILLPCVSVPRALHTRRPSDVCDTGGAGSWLPPQHQLEGRWSRSATRQQRRGGAEAGPGGQGRAATILVGGRARARNPAWEGVLRLPGPAGSHSCHRLRGCNCRRPWFANGCDTRTGSAITCSDGRGRGRRGLPSP